MDMREPTARRLQTRTFLFLGTAVLANSFGNLMLALAMDRMPAFRHVALLHYVLLALTNPFLLPGAVLTAVYTFTQLTLFSWADLSFVIPCTATSYILTTLLGDVVLGEHVETARWIGVLLILGGVTLVARTPIETKEYAEGARP
jgi:multidrug transporter EmrE-like cation transporter